MNTMNYYGISYESFYIYRRVIWLLAFINCVITIFDTQSLVYCTFGLHFGQFSSFDYFDR